MSPPRVCSVSGCGRRHCSNGLCGTHRRRMERHGSLESLTDQCDPQPGAGPERVAELVALVEEHGLAWLADHSVGAS